ncbi:MAG TPA: hydrogenase iron-sulfur subunit [Desulfatirhabdiaceae bacterium]|nr:hydrogenase iron-sulfur subunit [Desulfatirhabdiaceae bacterium]
MTQIFEPVIIAFCCHYCAYTAADMAGSQRICYPSNVQIIRVPCSGKVDTLHILKAFENGADGVYVAGCLSGDCHFKTGNIKAAKRVAQARKLLADIGIESDRVEMVNLSAGMGERFAEIAREMTEKIRKMGPSPVRNPILTAN